MLVEDMFYNVPARQKALRSGQGDYPRMVAMVWHSWTACQTLASLQCKLALLQSHTFGRLILCRGRSTR